MNYFKMSVEPEKMESKYYDMGARDAKDDSNGQRFCMSANDGEETGRIKHSEHKQTDKGI